MDELASQVFFPFQICGLEILLIIPIFWTLFFQIYTIEKTIFSQNNLLVLFKN